MSGLRGSDWSRFFVGLAIVAIVLSSAMGRKAIAAAAETSAASVTVGLLPDHTLIPIVHHDSSPFVKQIDCKHRRAIYLRTMALG